MSLKISPVAQQIAKWVVSQEGAPELFLSIGIEAILSGDPPPMVAAPKTLPQKSLEIQN